MPRKFLRLSLEVLEFRQEKGFQGKLKGLTMRLLLSLVISFLLVSGSAFAKTPKILKISDLKSGTKAIGFSVFKGIEPEHFDVELGEATEPLQLNLILARL